MTFTSREALLLRPPKGIISEIPVAYEFIILICASHWACRIMCDVWQISSTYWRFSMMQIQIMDDPGPFWEAGVCLGKKSIYFICYSCTEEGKIVTSVWALLWVVGLTIWFLVTEHGSSLLNYGTSWWILKSFILEAGFKYVYLSWSLPLVPVVQFCCSPMRNARQEAASCDSPCARLETGDRSRLVCAAFSVHLASHNLKALMNFFSVGPKEKKY